MMTLQDQPFKNCKKKECQHTTNEDKIQKNAHSIFKYNSPKTEILTPIYKLGAPSVNLPLISWLFIIPFNFGYVHITISGLNKYIKNSSDNKSFMVHEMYGCQCIMLKEIHIIFVYMIICLIADNFINTSTWRKRNTYCSVLIQ